MKILETDHLIIREVQLQDAAFIYNLMNSPGWLQYIGDRNIQTLENAEKYIQDTFISSYQKYGHGLYLVHLKEAQLSIGLCGLINRKELDDIDIGFALLPQYAGQGFAFEAASAIMEYGKAVLKFPKIVAITTIDNKRSINLLEKLGLHFEKVIDFNNEKLNLFST